MGKGSAKYGFKSGVLPLTRSILKNPTTKQETIIAKVKAPKPKGVEGVGYADGVMQPRRTHRVSQPVEFLDVEELIQKSAPAPLNVRAASTPQQEGKLRKAELRRKYLSEAFRKEEQRLLQQEELLKRKQEALDEEKRKEIALLNETKSSDLTIPTLDRIIEGPLMRRRTHEEDEILKMKRKYNREMIAYKAKERKLEQLLELYHVSNEFIVTEEHLLKNIDEAFANEGTDVLRTRLSMGAARVRSRNESSIGDALFGRVGGGEYVGIPLVKEFLSGEMRHFAKDVETKNNEVMEKKRNEVDNIVQI